MSVPDRGFSLVNHDPNQRAGHFSPTLDAGQLRVAGVFSKTTESGQSVAGEFSEGAPWKLSWHQRPVRELRPTDLKSMSTASNSSLTVFSETPDCSKSPLSTPTPTRTPQYPHFPLIRNYRSPPMAEDTARIAAPGNASRGVDRPKLAAADACADGLKPRWRLIKALPGSPPSKPCSNRPAWSSATRKRPLSGDGRNCVRGRERGAAIDPSALDPSLFEAMTATHGKPATPFPGDAFAADIFAARGPAASGIKSPRLLKLKPLALASSRWPGEWAGLTPPPASGVRIWPGTVIGRKTKRQAAAAPIPTIAGTGTGLMSALSFGPDVKVGSYVITLTATSSTAAFSVVDPMVSR